MSRNFKKGHHLITVIKGLNFRNSGTIRRRKLIEMVCVKPDEKDNDKKDPKTKFSVPNIQPKWSSPKPQAVRFPALEESEETRGLSIAQLERLVLLDQLKFYRMQMEELKSKKEEVKKKVSTTVDLLQERDCIAV